MSAATTPNWPYWRTKTRLSVSEAAHLLCDIEPPAPGTAYATARLQHADRLLRALNLVKPEARELEPGSSFVEFFESVEMEELLEAVSSGKLSGLGAELLRAMRPAAVPDKLQLAREQALREWLTKKEIPEREWRALRGWSLEAIYNALCDFRPDLFETIEFPSFKTHFWKKQQICKLRR